jgi:sec-independent protein translocase protein TatC
MKTPFNEDDYFKSSTMSFGQHLDELRTSLIKALWGLAVAMLFGFLAAPLVVRFFKAPIERALYNYYREKALVDLRAKYHGSPPVELENLINNSELVPEYENIDLSEFLDNLKNTYPGQFDTISFSPHTFVPEDFQIHEFTILWQGLGTTKKLVPTATKFARRLAAEGKAEPSTAGKSIWEMLTEQERELVGDVAAKKEEDVTADEKIQLALMLNRLIVDPQLHRLKEFATVESSADAVTSATIKELRERIDAAPAESPPMSETNSATDSVPNADMRRLNKLLLTSYFAGELRPAQLALVKLPIWKHARVRVQALNAQEAFMIWMKAAFMTGLVLSSPWIFYQLWLFVSAGLYPHEKNYVYWYLPISIALFAAGAALAFAFVFEQVLAFLFYFNRLMEIDPDPRIGEWLGFVLLMPLAFGLSFQLPLVMLFLNRIGLVDITTYTQHWRVAILIIAVAAMIITPGGDPYSMLLMMTPLIMLYFLGIAMCRWMPRGRNPFFEEVHEP